MTSRAVLVVIASVVAATAVLPSADVLGQKIYRKPVAPQDVRCPARSPVAASHRVKMFTLDWSLYACIRDANATSAVELASGTGPFDPFGSWWYAPTATGTMVAFGTGYSGRCSGYGVEVVDVRTRRIVSQVDAGTRSSYSESNDCSSTGAPVRSMVVRRDGVAAFITGWPGSGYEVAVSEPGGLRAIAHGSDIDPLSLEFPYGTPAVPYGFDRNQIAWQQGGARQTAVLAPMAPPAQVVGSR